MVRPRWQNSQSRVNQKFWERWDKAIAILALGNLSWVIFDISYIPLRDFWLTKKIHLFNHPSLEISIGWMPNITAKYDKIKGLKPHFKSAEYFKSLKTLDKEFEENGFTTESSRLAIKQYRILTLDIIDGIIDGMKSLILGVIILLCAMFIGQMTIQTGAGLYLTQLLGTQIPYWILPVLLLLISVCIAFSTGTSWGTYAVVFPIAMPLSWAVANYAGVSNPELFLTLCFAAVMDGAVFGDQCSPISDTTVLSAMCTGCDLMDHVKTQLPQATVAACLAAVCWTVVTLVFV